VLAMHSNDEGMGGESVGFEHDRVTSLTSGIGVVETLTDDDLLAGMRRLVCQSNRVLAALLAHLAEVEARGLHRRRACASLYVYCIYELRMSEDAAYRRVVAARLVKRLPAILGCVERGELHLTAVVLLAPHLTEANVVEVLARAKFRTKKEILKLVRLLSPLPDVPSRIEPLGLERPPAARATWSNITQRWVRELQPEALPSNWLPSQSEATGTDAAGADDSPVGETAPARNDAVTVEEPAGETAPARCEAVTTVETAPARNDTAPAEPMRPTPALERAERAGSNLDGPQRFKVQFTASEEYVALVEEAKALLSHALPRADIAERDLRAMQTLVAELKKRKYATSNPRSESCVVQAPVDHKLHLEEPCANHEVAPHAAESPMVSAERRSANLESPRQRGRYVPFEVRRAVFERDGNRCAYVDSRGERCRETSRLEFHHHEPFARGGPTTFDNLLVYCATHNPLAAEDDFGRERASEPRDHRYVTERNLESPRPASAR
jgi:hypothetical protein